MAYNSYYPGTYQMNYYGNPYQTQMVQQPPQTQPVQRIAQPTIQQSGFVLVPSEQEARNYPVAPGNSVTFKDENAPYCYVKTMGFNQFDRPTFERYRLVKEDSVATAQNVPTSADNAEGSNKDTTQVLKSDLVAIWGEIYAIKEKLKEQAEKKPAKKKMIEVEAEEDDE